jgi:transposase
MAAQTYSILYALANGHSMKGHAEKRGFASGMTCWRRLRDLQAAGLWEQLHLALLRRLREKPAATRQTGGNSGRDRASVSSIVSTFMLRYFPWLLLLSVRALGMTCVSDS